MITVRKATKKDISLIVKIHLERFSSFFLTSLGEFFLFNFYLAFLKKPGVLFVLEDYGEIKGFAAGSIKNKAFFKKLLFNNIIGFTSSGIKILFTNPHALKRIVSNVNNAEKNNIIFAELLSIATVKSRKGYGKILLNEFENEIEKNNKEKLPISLTTDLYANDKAIQFYKDSGYEILEIFDSYQNRKMCRFIKNNIKKKQDKA